jgi:hypothetical protein
MSDMSIIQAVLLALGASAATAVLVVLTSTSLQITRRIRGGRWLETQYMADYTSVHWAREPATGANGPGTGKIFREESWPVRPWTPRNAR